MSYEILHNHDFDHDPEYQAGLSSILGQVPAGLSEEEQDGVILDAKCFYISRKYSLDPPLESAQYQAWLQDSRSSSSAPAQNPETSSSEVPSTTAADASQPAYPPTFAELVDLITQNKPIPGIEEIPDTVIPDASLTAPSDDSLALGADTRMGRRKPWEKESQGEELEEGGETSQGLDAPNAQP